MFVEGLEAPTAILYSSRAARVFFDPRHAYVGSKLCTHGQNLRM